MPLPEHLREGLDSPLADLQNIAGRPGRRDAGGRALPGRVRRRKGCQLGPPGRRRPGVQRRQALRLHRPPAAPGCPCAHCSRCSRTWSALTPTISPPARVSDSRIAGLPVCTGARASCQPSERISARTSLSPPARRGRRAPAGSSAGASSRASAAGSRRRSRRRSAARGRGRTSCAAFGEAIRRRVNSPSCATSTTLVSVTAVFGSTYTSTPRRAAAHSARSSATARRPERLSPPERRPLPREPAHRTTPVVDPTRCTPRSTTQCSAIAQRPSVQRFPDREDGGVDARIRLPGTPQRRAEAGPATGGNPTGMPRWVAPPRAPERPTERWHERERSDTRTDLELESRTTEEEHVIDDRDQRRPGRSRRRVRRVRRRPARRRVGFVGRA